MAERPARDALLGDLRRRQAQREPAAHGRLPALSRDALRRRDPRPGDAARPRRARGRFVRDEFASTCRRCRASPATTCIARASRFATRAQRSAIGSGARAGVRASVAGALRPAGLRAHRRSIVCRCPRWRTASGRQGEPDRRQALCYQCHAPRASMQVFSGDDRTPVGVHEGLSCLACHASTAQTTRASCASCHPAVVELRPGRRDDGHDVQVDGRASTTCTAWRASTAIRRECRNRGRRPAPPEARVAEIGVGLRVDFARPAVPAGVWRNGFVRGAARRRSPTPPITRKVHICAWL